MNRCSWCEKNELMMIYHDTEWGVPLHDDIKLFEFLVLDAFQAGLSWNIVLQKREGFKKAFDNYNIKKIANYDANKVEELMKDSNIIRNRQKINATISNAKAFLNIQKEYESFDNYIWQFNDYKTITTRVETDTEIKSTSNESDAMSKDLQKRGFKFVGSTICYAFMQAAGMINDHVKTCFRYSELMDFSQGQI